MLNQYSTFSIAFIFLPILCCMWIIGCSPDPGTRIRAIVYGARSRADDGPWLALYAARSIFVACRGACLLTPVMYEVLAKNSGETGAMMRHKDFNFAAFNSWTLEVALLNCGEDIRPDGGNQWNQLNLELNTWIYFKWIDLWIYH